jgi:outer membrane protein assembly factor BamB
MGAHRSILWAHLMAMLAVGACGASSVRRPEPPRDPYPAGVVQVKWKTTLNDQSRRMTHPQECATGALVGDRFVQGASNGRIFGIGAGDGRVAWTRPVAGSIDSVARFDEKRRQVYVGGDEGVLHAVDPRDGAIRWSYKGQGAIERQPEMAGDTVYVSTATDQVFALDARTGAWRWQYGRETPDGFTVHGHAGLLLREAVLFAGFSDGYLVALEAPSGQVRWARSLTGASGTFVDVDTTAAAAGPFIVASSYSGGLYALRAQDGDVMWRLGLQGASALQAVAGRLYVAAPREGVMAMGFDGRVLWRQGLAEAGHITPPLAVGPYLVFSGSRAGLFVVDRSTGHLLEVFNPGRGACAAPAIAGRDLYLLVNSGVLYALTLR